MRVGIIGCGLIGKRRAQVASQSPDDQVIIVADIDQEHASALAEEVKCLATTDWQGLVGRDDLDAVVVATPNKFLLPAVVAALESGKHALCEKPLGRNAAEAEKMVLAARQAGKILKVGFNHRHHPAIWKAHELCAAGEIGEPMFIRAVYGHGGRPGYDKEWRGNADLAGGGELLDQGVHVVDLCRWFLGEFSEVNAYTHTYHWDLGYFDAPSSNLQSTIKNLPSRVPALWGEIPNQQLEDNAFALLKTSRGQVAQFHTSWTQWKNRFSFEVFGQAGYLHLEGLGGSYGVETLTVGRRRPESGPPHEQVYEFNGPDISWQSEWQEFTSAIREKRQPLANGEDGLQTMRVIAALYKSSAVGKLIHL